MDTESLVREQIDYYRARAVEYDETAYPPGDPLRRYVEPIEDALRAFAPQGEVLEIASGTGTWTRLLVEHAAQVTALDASHEMHEQSRIKLGAADSVRYIEADVLSWQPDRVYDVVFFANWLSHIPPDSFDRFWGIVEHALAPQGRVFLVDEGKDAWKHFEDLQEQFVHGPSVPIVRRSTRDGGSFHVVKVFWDPALLEIRLTELGWRITAHTSGPFFWAHGRRSGGVLR